MGNKGNKGAPTRLLSPSELSFLSSNSGLSYEEILDWHKQFLREFPDGYIDKAEFVNLYKK
jgi:hypothetical protein